MRAVTSREYRRIERTGLSVSEIGLGSGGPSQFGKASGVVEGEAKRMMRREMWLRINLIDTAAESRSREAILGRALKGVPRDSYVLCTKFTPVDKRGSGGLKDEGALAESLERSLQRLGTDYVDVFHLHGVAPKDYAGARDRFGPGAKQLQEQGKFRFLGLTETFAEDDHHETLTAALVDDIWA